MRAVLCGVVLLLIWAQRPVVSGGPICDPPGPSPRFACQWSVDVCDWTCPICDPFGSPPRASCQWDGQLCNWICPGYTGVRVRVQTSSPPARDAVVYVKLSSLCGANGYGATCSASFMGREGWTASAKCEALAGAVADNCGPAGYSVTANDCASAASFTVDNVSCPGTQFALGISNDSGVFDQTERQPLPDGESETTTGTCAPVPGIADHLRLAKGAGGSELQLNWDDAAHSQHHVVYQDESPNGTFGSVAGTSYSGGIGLTIPMPTGNDSFLVAGSNWVCGSGPKR